MRQISKEHLVRADPQGSVLRLRLVAQDQATGQQEYKPNNGTDQKVKDRGQFQVAPKIRPNHYYHNISNLLNIEYSISVYIQFRCSYIPYLCVVSFIINEIGVGDKHTSFFPLHFFLSPICSSLFHYIATFPLSIQVTCKKQQKKSKLQKPIINILFLSFSLTVYIKAFVELPPIIGIRI